ncbi:MAG: YIP1 family protein [Candidatus Methanofastidiosia archaeon]|jgi:hypothetical protein
MLQILNPFKAKNEFRKLKSNRRWILALVIVLIPTLLSLVGTGLIQNKNQELRQKMSEEFVQAQPEGQRGPRGPMGQIFPMGMVQTGRQATGITVLGVVIACVSALAVWVIKSGVFHIGSRLLGGESTSISSTIHIIAYTYIPFIFKGILDILKGITYEAPTSIAEIMTQPPDPLLNFVTSHFTIFVLWVMGLTIIALREQYNLSVKKALLVVVIPYIAAWCIQLVIMPRIGIFGGFS